MKLLHGAMIISKGGKMYIVYILNVLSIIAYASLTSETYLTKSNYDM